MFKKILLVSSLVFVLLVTYSYSTEDMRYVSNENFKNSQRTEALFNHDEHNEKAGIEDCASCHHLYDEAGKLLEDESSEDSSCSDCHIDGKKDGNKPSLMNAFHLSCIGCHTKEVKGPISCGECHKKK